MSESSNGQYFLVRPSGPLEGEIKVSGATKNSGLKQLAAAILAPGVSVFHNMPPVLDASVMIEVMRALGAQVEWIGPETLQVDTSADLVPEAPYELVSRMRASINVLGPLLGRCGSARVALPGGDAIGSRRLDMHIRGLEAMGAEARIDHGFIEARASVLKGARIVLEFPSVGATENLMTAAVLAKGRTVIDNAAREPEITALSAYLTRMGAQITGAGTSTIEIDGVGELVPVEAELMADRIEAGTLLMACGIAGGEISLIGPRLEHIEMLTLKLGAMGMKVSPTADGIWAFSRGRLKAVDIATLPHPGFATDFMPTAVSLAAVSCGSAIITENLFDGRFGFVAELCRMRADIRTEGRHAVVRGVERLSGCPVRATDVRAGAALVLAGLAADGQTEVHDVVHVDRGYRDLPGSLAALGADVTRVTV
jgi:UDP-N-acetylglucosamine 1-carboxyvinyltransferase